MKVAHLTTTDISLRYLVFPQLLEVINRGGEAVGISGPGEFVAELEEAGIRHVPLPSSTRAPNVRADLRAAAELWRVLKDERPDILHTHNPKPGIYGRLVGRLAGVPAVVNTVHGLYATPEDRLSKRAIVYLLEAIASRFSDAELIQSPEDLDLMRRLRIVSSKKSRLLGNGIDLDRFQPGKLDAVEVEQLRTEIDIGRHQVVVGMVGRLVMEKGYPELFDAVRILGDGYVVLAIGPHDPEKPDALPPEMLREAEGSGVRFLGMRPDVDRLYGVMDMFVLPSHREGFPRAAMEAAASGLPVVATDIRGCRQVVDDGVNGFLVPKKNPEALAQAIAKLGDDRGLREDMGAASRAKAEAEFDERQVVRIVMETYDQLMRDSGSASPGEPG